MAVVGGGCGHFGTCVMGDSRGVVRIIIVLARPGKDTFAMVEVLSVW